MANGYWKRSAKKLIAPALAASMLAVSPAEAQRPNRVPPVPRMAVPRDAPRQVIGPRADGRQFQTGVDRRSRNFLISFYYSNGMPFYSGFPGYFYSNFWFPAWYGPRPMFRSEIEYLQWSNLPQPWQLTVWEQRAMRNGLIPPPGYAMSAGYAMSPSGRYELQNAPSQLAQENEQLLKENQKLREQLARKEGEEAGYNRAREEFERQQTQQQYTRHPHEPAQPQPSRIEAEKNHVFGYAQNGRICPEQYKPEGDGLLNDVFNEVAINGGKRLHAYTYAKNGKPYTAVLDLGSGKLLLTEDYSSFSGRTGGELVEYVGNILEGLGIEKTEHINHTHFLDHSGQCRQ